MSEKVFLNDRLVDIDKACISVTDGGFLYGAGLFETMRSYNGVVFGLADHMDRLFFSANALSINHTYNKGFITEAIYKVIKANGLTDSRLRLTLTVGPMSQQEKKPRATLVITATQFQPYSKEYYQNGVLVVVCPFRQNPTEPIYGHKTINYFSRMIALNLARQKQAAEALWFTVDNRLAEGCISNVFLVKNSVLYTPFINTPVLAGVSRKAVCQIAMQNSIEFVEKDLYIGDVLDVDEIFLTNVIMQIMPICSVEKHTAGNGKVGPVTKRLQGYFDEFVKKQCQERK